MVVNLTNGVSNLRVAIVGGGRRCHSLIQVLESAQLERVRAEIVAVCDIDPDAVGIRYARDKGIFTTGDYLEILKNCDVELIINLTGSPAICPQISKEKPPQVAVLDYTASRIFQEIVTEVLDSSRRIEQQEDEIKRSHSFVRAMAEATVVGVLVLNKDFRISWINQAALKMFGLTRDQALGRYCFQVSHQSISPCDSPTTSCPMTETLMTGRSAHAIHEHVHHRTQATYCDVSTFPVLNKKGEVVQVLEVIRDITAELNTELERRTRAIKDDLAHLVQEDKLISLGKLVASVAHEINNPISSIINFNKLILEVIKEHPPTADDLARFEKYLDLSVREAARCGRIVKNLLAFSRQRTMEPKETDVSELLDRIVLLTQHQMALAGVELKLDLETRPLMAWGDAAQVQQCLANLVFNAMEAMPEGGRITVNGGMTPSGQEVWIEVRDTGVGISPENMDNIFEPFFTTKNQVRGVGMGLSVVYGIIREHRGDITVQSELGEGSVFRITLPTGHPEAA